MKKFLLSIALMASALISWADVVECTPGNLSNLVDNPRVEALTITGQMDARDFKFIADKLELLTSINLSGVEIVAYTSHGFLWQENNTSDTSIQPQVDRHGCICWM